MSKVFIPNKNANVYDAASKWGELVYVTDGPVKITSVGKLQHEVNEALKDSEPGDYILLAGPYAIVALLSAIFAAKHGRLNLLIYVNGYYAERSVEI